MIIWGTGTPSPHAVPVWVQRSWQGWPWAVVALWHQPRGLFLHTDSQGHHSEPSHWTLLKEWCSPQTVTTHPLHGTMASTYKSHNTTWARAGLIYGIQNSHILLPQATNGKRVMKYWLGFSKHTISFALFNHIQLHVQLSCLFCTCLGNGFMAHYPRLYIRCWWYKLTSRIFWGSF